MSERSESAWWQLADKHLIRYGGEFNPVLIERASGTRIYDRAGGSILDEALTPQTGRTASQESQIGHVEEEAQTPGRGSNPARKSCTESPPEGQETPRRVIRRPQRVETGRRTRRAVPASDLTRRICPR